jgi:hypothetical protein
VVQAQTLRRSFECGLSRTGVRRGLEQLGGGKWVLWTIIIHSIHLLLPSSGSCRSTYNRPSVITPSHHNLLPIHSHGFPLSSSNSTVRSPDTTTTPQHQPNSRESPRSHSSNSMTSGPVHGSLQRAREPYPPGAQLTSPAGPTGFALSHYTPSRPLLL